MLVDVVRLREDGRKLDADVVKAAVPVRGTLTLRRFPGRDQFGKASASCVAHIDGLPDLMYAKVTKIDGDTILIVGEEWWRPKMGASEAHPQTWWCRLVT